MGSIVPASGEPAQHRSRLNRAIKESLRDLGAQLSLLNHSVGARLDLKATDLACLDLISGTARSARAPWPGARGCTPPP
jgi:hypothetical protein